MITAVIGHSGSGKSLLARNMVSAIASSSVFIIDWELNYFYSKKATLKWFASLDIKYSAIPVVEYEQINRKNLIKNMLNSKNYKTEVENYVFDYMILPKIKKNKKNTNLIIDGILPRFIDSIYFDKVIYVTAKESVRIQHLKNRGMPEERINEILELQSDIFENFNFNILGE